MTKEDIVKAAFKVWGRELYRTTSLSKLARELGVSKPALYRHFRDKDALLEAMDMAFFDDCAAFLMDPFEKALSVAGKPESAFIMMRAIAEYYMRNKEAFVFSLIRLHSRREKEKRDKMGSDLQDRGIDLQRLGRMERDRAIYPSKIQMSITTLIFYLANFHHQEFKNDVGPSDELVKETLVRIEGRILKGLGLNAERVDALDYEGLEKKASTTEYEDSKDDALLKAVAEAVAEAGPWDASMEMVAKKSGLSKSGLYAHFKNRQDMMGRFFITEFSRIVNFARVQVEMSEAPEEQLYLAIVSIVNYLRSRPEIFGAIDWIKTRHLELGKEASGRLYRIIVNIKLEAIQKYDKNVLLHVAQWILFLIVNTLALWPSMEAGATSHRDSSLAKPGINKNWAKNIAEIPNESFRVLFRFIALGLEGLNT